MKVVTPPITDMSILGRYIARECHDMPTYMLTKVYCNGSSSGQLSNIILNNIFFEQHDALAY